MRARCRSTLGACLVALLQACASAGRVSDQSLSSAVQPLPAGVDIQTSVTEYVIRGTTVQELLRSMQAQGMETDGRRWPGTARWRTNLRWQYERRAPGCALKDLSATIVAQVDVPTWRRDYRADARVVHWWEESRRRLFDHEVGHILIERDGAREILETVRPMTDDTCEALAVRANQVAQDLMAKHRRQQDEYDERTAHGTRPDPAASTKGGARHRGPSVGR